MAITDNIKAYWKLDESSGNAVDSTGNAFTLVNNGTATYATGKVNNGVDFGSSNTTKSLTNTSILTGITYPVSITGWFKADIANDNGNIFSMSASGGNPYYQLKCRNTDSHLVFRSNTNINATDVDTGQVVSTGTWYHFAVILHSATSVSLYVNASITNTTATIDNATGLDKFGLGALVRATPVQFFSGMVDEVGYWERAITGADITRIYNNGYGNQYTFGTYTQAFSAGSFALTGQSINTNRLINVLMGAGSFLLTGQDATFGRLYTAVMNAGSFILNGFDVVTTYIEGWRDATKHSSTASNTSKSTMSTMINLSQSSATWSSTDKS